MLTGRAQEILEELQAQVKDESPRDPAALCRRLRDVEISLASELVELSELRANCTKRWNEERYQVTRDRIQKRLAQTQSILANLLARFPNLSGEDAQAKSSDIREVRAVLLGYMRGMNPAPAGGDDAPAEPEPSAAAVPDPTPAGG